MLEGESCALPPQDTGESVRRWRSAHGAITLSVWVLVALAGAALAAPSAALGWAVAAFSGAMAASMGLARWALTLDGLRVGSGMNPRSFAVYWNGQTLSYTVGVGVLAAAAAFIGSVPSAVLLILVVATCLTAQLTPFCLGRFVWVMLFEPRA